MDVGLIKYVVSSHQDGNSPIGYAEINDELFVNPEETQKDGHKFWV